MKNLQTYDEFLVERRTFDHGTDYLTTPGTKDENAVKLFVEYNGLDTIVNDIWKYADKNFGVYPSKILPEGMVYYTKGSTYKVEIKFEKNKKPYLYLFPGLKDNLIKAGEFSYKLFAELLKWNG